MGSEHSIYLPIFGLPPSDRGRIAYRRMAGPGPNLAGTCGPKVKKVYSEPAFPGLSKADGILRFEGRGLPKTHGQITILSGHDLRFWRLSRAAIIRDTSGDFS
jgi:hypothetical protein